MRLCRPNVMRVCGHNNVRRAVQTAGFSIDALRFSDQGTKENLMLGVVGSKV